MKVLSMEYKVWKEELKTFIRHIFLMHLFHIFNSAFKQVKADLQSQLHSHSVTCHSHIKQQLSSVPQHLQLPGLEDLPAQT